MPMKRGFMDKRDYGKRLANAIATQMRRKGITQEQLGSMIGVSQRTISDYASGKTAPSYDVMARMAVILEISLDSVFMLKGDEAAFYLDKEESRLIDLYHQFPEDCRKMSVDLYAEVLGMLSKEDH